MASLTSDQRAAYERIVASGTERLARWSTSNPMRQMVANQVADARAKLGVA